MRVKNTNRDEPNEAPSPAFKQHPEFMITALTFLISFLPFEVLRQGIAAVILFLLGAATWTDMLISIMWKSAEDMTKRVSWCNDLYAKATQSTV
jgi:hypothetical protein